MKLGFIYEHPTWSNGLIEAFSQRDIELELINVADLSFSTDIECFKNFDLAINRVNIMPSANRRPQVVFQTLHFLSWLELSGVRIINGSRAHFIGASKAMQNGIFSKLGLHHPEAIAIYRPEDALSAAEKIGYPVIIKPNIGGSGSGVSQFVSEEELRIAIQNKSIDLGVDRTGLVQQFIQSDGFVYRVEMLGGQLFYTIRQAIQEESFNYCAADGCSMENSGDTSKQSEFDFCATDGESRIQAFQPEKDVINDIKRILKESEADAGGVEYLMHVDRNLPCFYDINPYSNFVTDSESLLGFSAESRFVDYVLSQIN